jgi:hypothetical protein
VDETDGGREEGREGGREGFFGARREENAHSARVRVPCDLVNVWCRWVGRVRGRDEDREPMKYVRIRQGGKNTASKEEGGRREGGREGGRGRERRQFM